MPRDMKMPRGATTMPENSPPRTMTMPRDVAPRTEAALGREYLPAPPLPAAPAQMTQQQMSASPSAPASCPPLELDGLLDLATQNNPTLKQAQAHVSAELGKALEAGLYPNPRFIYSGDLIGVPNQTTGAHSAGEFQGGLVQQEIITGGKLALSRQKYMQRARISEHLAVAQQFKVLNDVRMYFYRALAQYQILQVRRELLKTAEDRALTVREMYNVGQARRPQVRLADIELQRARLEVMSAENEYAQRLQQLSSVVGMPLAAGHVQGELASTCEPIPFDAALQRLWSESPQLAAVRAKLAADQITVQREEVQWIPNLTFSGGTGYDFENRSSVSAAGMQLNVPLFDRNQGTVRQAQADLFRQRNEVMRVELELRTRLAEIYQRYLTAHQHVVQYQRVILPEARAAYRELLEGYQANRAEWPEVLAAQHEYFDAQREYIQQLEMLRVNEVLVYGYLLHGGLDAAAGPTPPGHIDSVPKPR